MSAMSPSSVLADGAEAPTHVVSVPRTFLYPGPDLKFPKAGELVHGLARRDHRDRRDPRHGIRIAGLRRGDDRASIWRRSESTAADYVAVAETLIHTPYLWGGVSGFGIDCSGLVQLVDAHGRQARAARFRHAGGDDRHRDRAGCGLLGACAAATWSSGRAMSPIMTDPDNMIHASGHTMTVAREPLRQAIDRIGYLYGGPTGFRRPA